MLASLRHRPHCALRNEVILDRPSAAAAAGKADGSDGRKHALDVRLERFGVGADHGEPQDDLRPREGQVKDLEDARNAVPPAPPVLEALAAARTHGEYLYNVTDVLHRWEREGRACVRQTCEKAARTHTQLASHPQVGRHRHSMQRTPLRSILPGRKPTHDCDEDDLECLPRDPVERIVEL